MDPVPVAGICLDGSSRNELNLNSQVFGFDYLHLPHHSFVWNSRLVAIIAPTILTVLIVSNANIFLPQNSELEMQVINAKLLNRTILTVPIDVLP